jgi:thiol-disulfide isomerase/thioredoxin
MSAASRRRPQARKRTSSTPLLLVLIGIGVIAVAIGVAVALGGSGTEDAVGGQEGDAPASFGPVDVSGDPLPIFTSTDDDPARGLAAPELVGQTPDGAAVSVGGSGPPSLVVFLAHWCPHCQAELPILVDLAEQGAFDGVRTVAVLTGTNPQAPNYPPTAWLEEEGWTGEVMVDDPDTRAAAAYGLAGYPFLVVLDPNGEVVARSSGELPPEDVVALVEPSFT